jgi:LAS superfamily LD-carboxypeptidase LdcB
MSVDNPMDVAQRRVILEVRSSRSLDSVEDYRTIQHELATQQAAAEAASARAVGHRADVTSRLAELKAAHAQQEQLAAQIDDRLDRELSEADSLASLDTTLAGQISQQQTALAQRVAAERRAAEAALAAARVRTSSGAGASRNTPARSFPNTDGAGIVTVQGIQVHSSIAGSLDAMLTAARGDGVVLSGGGYRNPAGQIAVRRSNCGSSNYAIYEMPASSCSPPTARPGTSMHERGLAIDFTQGGSTLNRSSAGYHWLKANAAGYGFYNLPSEAWHWSTNGN